MGQVLPIIIAVIAWPFSATGDMDLAFNRPAKPQIMAVTEKGSQIRGIRLTTPR
jgi:hypothetical protein